MVAVLGGNGERSEAAMRSFGRVTSLDDLPSDKPLARYVKKAAELNESDGPAQRPPRPGE
jgi:hypothetical protein